MSLKWGEQILAGAIVFGALLFAVGSVTWWSDDNHACPVPGSGNFWEDTANPAECRLLRHFPNIVQRDGKRLVVTLVSGRSRIFADEGECWVSESCTFYVLGSITPDESVIGLWLGAAEGGDAMLFDRQSGEEITIGEFPEMSSDSSYWAVVDSSPLDGTGVAQVIRHDKGRFTIVAEGNGEFCDFERWETAPTFLAICYDREEEKRMEFRFALDSSSKLARIVTGRSLTPEEERPN